MHIRHSKKNNPRHKMSTTLIVNRNQSRSAGSRPLLSILVTVPLIWYLCADIHNHRKPCSYHGGILRGQMTETRLIHLFMAKPICPESDCVVCHTTVPREIQIQLQPKRYRSDALFSSSDTTLSADPQQTILMASDIVGTLSPWTSSRIRI